jgi:hypothetical protein
LTEDQLTILLLIAIGGSGTAAGYFARVVQKYEERQDTIHLTKLPALFSSLFNFVQLSRAFRDGGASIDEFADRLDKLVENIGSEIFAGEIILYEKEIYDELANLYPRLHSLNAIAKKVKENKNSFEKVFRFSFTNNQEFEHMKPCEIVTSAEKITDSIRTRFKRYKSISIMLLVALFVLGAAIAAIEYFRSITS